MKDTLLFLQTTRVRRVCVPGLPKVPSNYYNYTNSTPRSYAKYAERQIFLNDHILALLQAIRGEKTLKRHQRNTFKCIYCAAQAIYSIYILDSEIIRVKFAWRFQVSFPHSPNT